jgi:F-type H+-transporting ATPase subunit delta
MADSLTIARPYARALFSDACDDSTFEDWQLAIEAFALIVQGLSEQQAIGNPNISDEQMFMLCFDLIKSSIEVKSDFEGELKRFIELILFEGRLRIVPDIARLYHKLVIEHDHIVEAEVISASALSEAQQQTLISTLEKRFNSKVQATYSEDPSLIGGLMVKSDGWVFDGTIRSKLTRLAERII